MRLVEFLLVLSLITFCWGQYLIISHPSDLAQTFRDNRVKVVSSPIGFKPSVGTLHGRLSLAQPPSACEQLDQIAIQQNEDIFIMADDQGCLESVKANNIANTGAYVGIIRRNINNTLHDRQINLVHLPILEIQPNDYDSIVTYMKKNANTNITLMADFNPEQERKKVKIQLWLSPTQDTAYQYILNFKNFIKNQSDKVAFKPRFVLHSQTNRKQYIGCYSSGKYCPPDLEFEGKPEGSKIVGQSLRQLIIAANDQSKWFDYVNYFSQKCLRTWSLNLWLQQNSELCSQSAMMSTGIDSQQVFKQFNKSFEGNRPEVDGNIYLEQERQSYLTHKITTYPILLVNGKQYELQDPEEMKFRMCTMIHPDPNQQPPQCQNITNPPVFTTGEILVGVGILIAIMVLIMCVCKQVIYRKMKNQMRGEVDKTLSQYYRYMESFQQPDPHGTGKVPLVETKAQSNQIGSVQLHELKPNK